MENQQSDPHGYDPIAMELYETFFVEPCQVLRTCLQKPDGDLSDDDEDLDLDCPTICLTKELKRRIRLPSKLAVIIKPFGRSFGFNFIYVELQQLWKSTSKMEVIDLGKGYFVSRFSNFDDHSNVLHAGP
ncbi:Endonuclease/exonuclease/phosphatase [Quillaja saponaria]|uniref:Endonuclease/exonuclease/phosphatase n=1 Tax=Quillaja saponaria TaxID=32244 RepID=A0AAD7Q823_QUISA|nr:Endonuclease/exonuclease/phosphatase [Quillaja saponaria]